MVTRFTVTIMSEKCYFVSYSKKSSLVHPSQTLTKSKISMDK